KGLGYVIEGIKSVKLGISTYRPFRGGSYIKLAAYWASKKAIVNVKNEDNECFRWAILSKLFPVDKNTERLTNYTKYKDHLKFDGITFPVEIDSIPKFEKLNNIVVNVFTYEDKRLYPLYLSKLEGSDINNMVDVFSSQMGKRNTMPGSKTSTDSSFQIQPTKKRNISVEDVSRGSQV